MSGGHVDAIFREKNWLLKTLGPLKSLFFPASIAPGGDAGY